MRLGSVAVSDDEFLAAIESCSHAAGSFHHADHLRLGWILLSRMPLAPALERAATAIRRFAGHHGKEAVYHETITRGWMLLLASHDEADFTLFVRHNMERLSPALLHEYWEKETLNSDRARAHWVEPDIRPLPEPVPRRQSA